MYPTTTTAASAPRAASAAAGAPRCGSAVTISAPGIAARRPSTAVTTYGARTSDDPWSPVLATSARRPTTARRRRESVSSGSAGAPDASSFLRSTTARRAASRARSTCSALTTVPRGSSASRPAWWRSCVARMRTPARSTSAQVARPSSRASRSHAPRCWRNGASTSSPAASAFAPSRIPQMKSVTTVPSKPQSSRRTVVRVYGF
ncbi:Uncharacterised protein [Mycobacteroides abscessus]|nr:Uncharacterised protein [Mycobacteroides abscessus]